MSLYLDQRKDKLYVDTYNGQVVVYDSYTGVSGRKTKTVRQV